MYILLKTTGGPRKKSTVENEDEDDQDDDENEQETVEDDDTENPPVPPKRQKRQEVHTWNWSRAPLDMNEPVVEDANLMASEKAVAVSESVHSSFQQHLKRNKRATVSNKN